MNPAATARSLAMADPSVSDVVPVLMNRAGGTDVALLPKMVVKFSGTLPEETVLGELAGLGLVPVKKQSFTDSEHLFRVAARGIDPAGIFALTSRVMDFPSVEWAEPNLIAAPQFQFALNDDELRR